MPAALVYSHDATRRGWGTPPLGIGAAIGVGAHRVPLAATRVAGASLALSSYEAGRYCNDGPIDGANAAGGSLSRESCSLNTRAATCRQVVRTRHWLGDSLLGFSGRADLGGVCSRRAAPRKCCPGHGAGSDRDAQPEELRAVAGASMALWDGLSPGCGGYAVWRVP